MRDRVRLDTPTACTQTHLSSFPESHADRLNDGGRLLLGMGTSFMAALALSGTFVNVYIWKVEHSYIDIGLFNLLVFGTLPLAFLCSGFLARRVGELWILRAGVVSLAVFFAILLTLGERSVNHALWLGTFFGIGQGLYWFAFHVLTFDLTKPDNRGHFNGLAGLFGSLVSMTGPYMAGYLIVHGRRFSGYHVIFALSLLLFGILLVLSFRLPRRAEPHTLRLREGFRFRADPDWRRLWIGSIVFGLREGVFSFFIGLLVFFVARNEEGLGLYGLWTGLISLGSFFLAGKVVRKQRVGNRLMGAAAWLMGLIALVLLLPVRQWTLVLFGAVTAFALPFFVVPFGTMIMNEIDESAASAKHRAEHLISRELALGIGRTVSVLVFLTVARHLGSPGSFAGMTVCLAFAHTVVYMFVHKVTFTPRRAAG